VLTLILEEYPAANSEFNEQHGIQLLRFGMEGNKEPFRSMPRDTATAALAAVLDPSNRPLLIHCNEGKHRTGTVVGLLRRHRGWALSSVLDEYILYAGAKARVADQIFIEHFDPDPKVFWAHFNTQKKQAEVEVLPPPSSSTFSSATTDQPKQPPPIPSKQGTSASSLASLSDVSAQGTQNAGRLLTEELTSPGHEQHHKR